MKKVIYFLPLVIFALFYGFIGILAGFNSISPIVFLWLILFAICGYLLLKNIFWGALIGILPAIHLIYMSTQDTGQIIDIELPSGVIILSFYMFCGYLVYKSNKTK